MNRKKLGLLVLCMMVVVGLVLGRGYLQETRQTVNGMRQLGDFRVLTGAGLPSIAVDAKGNVHIVSSNYMVAAQGLYYRKLDNDGGPLGTEVRITDSRSILPALAVDSGSNLHIVWQGEMDGIWGIYHRKLDNDGNSLTQIMMVTTSGARHQPPSIAIGFDDSVHIAWYDDSHREIRYMKLDANGRDLTGEIRVGHARAHAASAPVSIAVDSRDNVHIVWRDDTPYTALYYRKMDSHGTSLTEEIIIPEGGVNSHVNPTIAVDSMDNVHVVWQDGRRPRKWDIYYKKLDNNGVSLTSAIALVEARRHSQKPAIAVDSGDNIHVVWSDDRHEEDFRPGRINHEIYYKKLDNNGEELTGEIRITRTDYQSRLPVPAIAVDSDANVHIVWEDSRYGGTEDWMKCGIYYNQLRGK